jgi:hypothetical protein
MSNPYLIENLSVGHRLPNGWEIVAYAVVDRHAVVLASMEWGDLDHPETRYATWKVSQDDLRSTSSGRYFNDDHGIEDSFVDFRERVGDMYRVS